MNLAEVFDLLLTKRQIALCLPRPQANSLRVSLIRKFKDYQSQMHKLGWLSDDLAAAVVSLEWVEETATANFFLRPPKRQQITYQLLTPSEASDDSQD